MTAPAIQTTSSDAYEVSKMMLLSRIGCGRTTLWQYERLGWIPKAKRREGVKGSFYTVAQANRLLTRIGSTAERFEEQP